MVAHDIATCPDPICLSCVTQAAERAWPYGQLIRTAPADVLAEIDAEFDAMVSQLYTAHDAEYRDDRCAEFQGRGEHYARSCGAPHCPWYTPRPPVGQVGDHSLGSRDELLSHIQRCADQGMTYEQLYEEAHRVELAVRPADPWTDKDLVPMIVGALRKAPAHMAENKARADADYVMLGKMGVLPGETAGQVTYPVYRVRHGKKRIQWSQ